MAQINVNDTGLVTVKFPPPEFLGTTLGTGSNFYSAPGTAHDIFNFRSKGLNWGTVIFDRSQKERRGVSTPEYLQVSWEKGKVVVREGLEKWDSFYKKGFMIDSKWGRYFTPDPRKPTVVYHDGFYRGPATELWLVDIVDLFRFVENKIDEEELKRRIIRT